MVYYKKLAIYSACKSMKPTERKRLNYKEVLTSKYIKFEKRKTFICFEAAKVNNCTSFIPCITVLLRVVPSSCLFS